MLVRRLSHGSVRFTALAATAAVACMALLAFAPLSAQAAATPAGGAPAGKQPLPAGVEHRASVEGIDEYLLTANGLKILLFPDPSKPTTTVNITYLVGSRHENYGETGMAHLLEHLLFKGSTRHPNVPAELTAHGARPNGSTWYDRTNYFETFSASEENLAWALDLEADRMVNSFIAKKDLDSEMSVVRNEFEQGENDPDGVLEERVVSTAYLWHNYGNSTIGCRADIERVPIERLQAFYRTWYQPDNAVLVVAGKFDRDRTLALIVEKFGVIPRPSRVLPATYTEEPAQDGERTVTLRRVGDTQLVKLAYHIPSGSHPDFAAIDLLGRILGDSPSGRLHKALVEPRLATSVRAWPMQFHDPGLLLLTAEAGKEAPIDQVRDEMIRVTQALATSPPTSEELERARQSLLKDWELSMRNSPRAAIGLSEWAGMGDWRLLFLHRDRLRAVTASDPQRVAAAFLVDHNRTTGLFIPADQPARAPIPSTPETAAMVEGHTGGSALSQGEEFDPSPANIESRVIRTTLPCGLEVILLPKKSRGGTVAVTVDLHFGEENSLQNQAYVGRLTGNMLMRGTAKRSRQEIQDALDAMKARLNLGGGGGRWGGGVASATELRGGGEVGSEHLADYLRLLAEILRQPAFPAEEFTQLQEAQIRNIEEGRSDPRTLAGNRLQRHLNPWPKGDPRYVATPEEEIEGLRSATVQQVAAFHRDFYGASAAELAIAGDFDPAQVQPLVAELFGDWKSARPHQRLVSAYRDLPALTESIETPDKESAVLSAGLRIHLRDDDPDYPALVLANFMTGGGFLNSRLATRIRQKEGFSYGVGSYFQANAFDPVAGFGAFAIYAPQNLDGIDRALREEIARVVADGFTDEEVAAAKSGWLQQQAMSRGGERELAGTLATRAYEGRDLRWDEALEARVASLTPAEIHAAVKKHLDPARLSVVHAGDFAGAAHTP